MSGPETVRRLPHGERLHPRQVVKGAEALEEAADDGHVLGDVETEVVGMPPEVEYALLVRGAGELDREPVLAERLASPQLPAAAGDVASSSLS